MSVLRAIFSYNDRRLPAVYIFFSFQMHTLAYVQQANSG